jgi:hypothetical protein
MNKIKNPSWTAYQCISTKIVQISSKTGKRTAFILELVSQEGEISTKFFNVNVTPKGSYSVHPNSDFGKLYRLTIGENPQKRFSRCDQLLKHFIGHQFFVQTELANCKTFGDYTRVKSIKPELPIVNDGWTITGHLIKAVRKESANNWRTIGEELVKNRRKVGDCNLASGQVKSGLADDLNPTLNPTYPRDNLSTSVYNIGISNSKPDTPLPDIDLASIEINQHNFH